MGLELFLPAGERTENAANQVAEAKGVCAQCGVRLHCLTDALVANPDDGIWGGPTPRERTTLRRTRGPGREDSRVFGRGHIPAPKGLNPCSHPVSEDVRLVVEFGGDDRTLPTIASWVVVRASPLEKPERRRHS